MARHFESPRSILITGASSGIGEALARAYAASGVALALTGRDQARLAAVAAPVTAAPAAPGSSRAPFSASSIASSST